MVVSLLMSDARSWSAEVQEQTRRTAVRMVSEQGFAPAAAAAAVGVNAETVRRWVRLARVGGGEALAAGRRGRPVGQSGLLTARQQELLVAAIEGGRPDQYMLPQLLWTRQAVADLAAKRFGVQPALRTVSTWLADWGFTAKKPVWRVMSQNEDAVREFMTTTYPALAARAKAERAEIWFLDESGVRVDAVRGRGYAKRGSRALATKPARRKGVNIIQAATRNGRHAFSCFEGSADTTLVIGFLERLADRAAGKIIVVLDNHSIHRGPRIRDFLASGDGTVELVYLPTYAPELNPVEFGNNDLKGVLEYANDRPTTTAALLVRVRRTLHSLSRRHGRVASWFHAKELAYIHAAHTALDTA